MSRKCELLGVKPIFGNKVSHSNRKTRRKFLPNLKKLSFKSEVLGVDLRLRVAASTLRTVNNKFGTIDSFLVSYRFAKLSETAQKLRIQIKRKLVSQGRLDEFLILRKKPKVAPEAVVA
jgi:large subunit ribosomal protein L28